MHTTTTAILPPPLPPPPPTSTLFTRLFSSLPFLTTGLPLPVPVPALSLLFSPLPPPSCTPADAQPSARILHARVTRDFVRSPLTKGSIFVRPSERERERRTRGSERYTTRERMRKRGGGPFLSPRHIPNRDGRATTADHGSPPWKSF